MLKIENILNTSFDELMENIFEKTPGTKSGNSTQILNNLGDYIEIYREKKNLEVRKKRLDTLLYVKDAVIDDLQERITEQAIQGKALIEEKENAVNESRNKTLELAKTSHEIRTPISGILGTTKLLLETELTQEQKKLIGIIETSSQSLLTLINDILDYSKIKSDAVIFEQLPIDLQSMASEIVDILSFQAKEKNTCVDCWSEDGVPDLVEGDPLRVKQVLLNLTGNAVKFTENGEVNIRMSVIKKLKRQVIIKFEISDTGIGIPEDKLSDLFKNFVQVSTSVTKKYGGTGLGLAISKELVEKMDGEIGVNSKAGIGTTFWFTIPFYNYCDDRQKDWPSTEKPNLKRHSEKKYLNPAPSHKDIQVLLVEDDEINMKVNSLLLDKWGYKVKTAENGKEAISMLQTNHYDVILMDIHMPEMDGLEATKAIRQAQQGRINSEIPIIAMTANTLNEDKKTCLEAGMDDFLTKPINVEQLSSKIDQQLSKKIHDLIEPPTPAQKTINSEELKQLQLDTKEDFDPLVKLFLDQLPKRIQNIKTAVKSGDHTQLQASAHQLKGSASNFCAVKLVDICSRMEKLDLPGSEKQALQLVSELESEKMSVVSALQSVLDWTIGC